MGDAGKPGPADGLHIHHGAHGGACSRQTAQQRGRRVADALADQFAHDSAAIPSLIACIPAGWATWWRASTRTSQAPLGKCAGRGCWRCCCSYRVCSGQPGACQPPCAGLTPRGNTRHRGKSIGLWRLCRAVAAPQPPGRTLPIDQPDLPGSRTIHSVSHRSGNREPETG